MNPNYATVAERATHRCEYCKAPELVFNFPFEVEHIHPLSRQGSNELDNLALACRSCNLRKGNRVSGYCQDTDREVRLFHPRTEQWPEHFKAESTSGKIIGLSDIGHVTVTALEMNSPAQTTARQLWIRLNLFP